MASQKMEFDLNKICVLLESEDKDKRKKGLKNIQDILNNEDLVKIWEILHRPLIKLLSDSAEICRDRSLEILKIFMNGLPIDDRNIVYIIPILSRRLGSQELIEPSEEVRLNAIKLLRQILSKYKEELSVYMEDLMKILSKTVKDNYSEVKRESCSCISELGENIPRSFYTCSEILVEPILSNFTHQHYKVRSSSIRTIGDVVQYGNSKIMEKVGTPMAERLFDQNPVVRSAVIEVTGRWLVKLRDRYSWWYKLIPLIMTGLNDEIEDIRIRAAEMWDAAGRLYMEENENDEKFKDKLDFLTEHPKHYPLYISRPNLGCRVIAQQNMCKLVHAIGNELGDWMFDIRVRSAQLLCVLVLNVEEEVTQHIEQLLAPMYRAGNDRDRRVVENIEKAAEYLGYFVPADVYCDLILPTMEECVSPGHLRIFSAILKGSEKTCLASQLNRIGDFLQQDYVLNNRKSSYQKEILNCCNALVVVSKEDTVCITKQLFDAIFITLSMTTEVDVEKEAQRLLDEITKFNDLIETEELYKIHLRSLLMRIGKNENIWSVYTMEAIIFRACLINAGIAVAMNMDLVLPILRESTNDRADPELRVKHLILLSDYLSRDSRIFHCVKDFKYFVNIVLGELIIPNLIWSVGRVAESIRTAALFCLCTILENDSIPFMETEANSLFDKIIPILNTSMEDNAKKTRLYSLKAMCLIMNIGKRLSLITEEHINRTYPGILKRLDDGCNDVRFTSVEALGRIWAAVPEDYNLIFNKSHVDVLYTTTIVHLDDPDSDFRSLMLDAMMKLANIHPELLAEKLKNCRTNFQNQHGIDQLLEHCRNRLSKMAISFE